MLDARNFIGGVCQFNSLVTRRFGSGSEPVVASLSFSKSLGHVGLSAVAAE
jgi:hypothetical protein